MYTDYAPPVNDLFGGFHPVHPLTPTNYEGHGVVVVEGGEKAKDVIALARRKELTNRDADGHEIFWIVFASEPKRVWDFTGKALRQTLWTMRTRQSR